jgi:hypothetical protein
MWRPSGGTERALGALIGPARSGTTWAGSIIDSSPDVVYRFEPFHRMSAVDPAFRQWFEMLKNQSVTDDDVPRLYDILLEAHPLTDKAPFFRAKSYPLRSFGRDLMWPVARVLRPASWIYRAAYSPRPGPAVVFKEVTFIKPLRNLLERTSVPVVYLVRHPCPTVMSEVRRQIEGRPSVRQRRLRELLLEHAPWLVEQFPDVVAGSDAVKRTALLWRCEIEICVNLVRQSRSGMVITYEQLAEDAHARTSEVFSHLGIEFGEPTKRFLDSLYELEAYGARGPRRTGWGEKYFSVYRNPREEKDAWKRKIPAEDRASVESIVQGSGAIEYCAALGQWW